MKIKFGIIETILKYTMILGIVFYLICRYGQYEYYGSIGSLIKKIPILVTLIGGSFLVAWGISKEIHRGTEWKSIWEITIILIFLVKLIIDIFLSVTLNKGVMTKIGWIIYGDFVFYYYIIYDIILCIIGISWGIISISLKPSIFQKLS